MAEFIHRLKSILFKVESIYIKSSLIALSGPLKSWHSTISTTTMNKSTDINPNTPSGKNKNRKIK